MAESFDAKVISVHHALEGAGVPYAFGGAIALTYYSIPRATVDIDVNVFVSEDTAGTVLDALARLGVQTAGARRQIERSGQCRVMWDITPIDLFFANLAFHSAMKRATRRVHFVGKLIPVLAPEHLLVCKALFDRDKDWWDIANMLVTLPDLRVEEVTRWMDEIAGPGDSRSVRVRAKLAEFLGRD